MMGEHYCYFMHRQECLFATGAQAGKCLPLVSSPKGTSANPSRKINADIATGIPIVWKWRIPMPTRNVKPAAVKRPKLVMKAKALARHSVLYCSGSQKEYTMKFAPPKPSSTEHTINHAMALCCM